MKRLLRGLRAFAPLILLTTVLLAACSNAGSSAGPASDGSSPASVQPAPADPQPVAPAAPDPSTQTAFPPTAALSPILDAGLTADSDDPCTHGLYRPNVFLRVERQSDGTYTESRQRSDGSPSHGAIRLNAAADPRQPAWSWSFDPQVLPMGLDVMAQDGRMFSYSAVPHNQATFRSPDVRPQLLQVCGYDKRPATP